MSLLETMKKEKENWTLQHTAMEWFNHKSFLFLVFFLIKSHAIWYSLTHTDNKKACTFCSHNIQCVWHKGFNKMWILTRNDTEAWRLPWVWVVQRSGRQRWHPIPPSDGSPSASGWSGAGLAELRESGQSQTHIPTEMSRSHSKILLGHPWCSFVVLIFPRNQQVGSPG